MGFLSILSLVDWGLILFVRLLIYFISSLFFSGKTFFY